MSVTKNVEEPLLNKALEIERNQAMIKDILVRRQVPTNLLAEAMVGTLGEEAKNWRPEDAKAECLKRLYDIKASNSLTSFDNFENLMEVFTILVENSEIDWRMTPFLMEKKRLQIAQNREILWRGWCNINWNKICDEFERTGSFKIPLFGLGTLEPITFNVDTGEPSKRIILHIPQRQNPGVVFSTSKEDHSFLKAMIEDLARDNDSKFKSFSVSPGEGANWQLNVYSMHQRQFENISGWVRERLATQAKLYGGLPKYVFMETPLGKVSLKGIGGDAFIPGYRITLTKEARREFGEEIDDDTVKEFDGKRKKEEQSTEETQKPNEQTEEESLKTIETTDSSQAPKTKTEYLKPKGKMTKLKEIFS
jgi:hypothetical protein